jgi:hypothetical protein
MVARRCLEHAPESNRHDISGAWNRHLPIVVTVPILFYGLRSDVVIVIYQVQFMVKQTNDVAAIYDTLAHELYASEYI